MPCKRLGSPANHFSSGNPLADEFWLVVAKEQSHYNRIWCSNRERE